MAGWMGKAAFAVVGGGLTSQCHRWPRQIPYLGALAAVAVLIGWKLQHHRDGDEIKSPDEGEGEGEDEDEDDTAEEDAEYSESGKQDDAEGEILSEMRQRRGGVYFLADDGRGKVITAPEAGCGEEEDAMAFPAELEADKSNGIQADKEFKDVVEDVLAANRNTLDEGVLPDDAPSVSTPRGSQRYDDGVSVPESGAEAANPGEKRSPTRKGPGDGSEEAARPAVDHSSADPIDCGSLPSSSSDRPFPAQELQSDASSAETKRLGSEISRELAGCADVRHCDAGSGAAQSAPEVQEECGASDANGGSTAAPKGRLESDESPRSVKRVIVERGDDAEVAAHLRAYDDYLADPDLSPTMRGQVLRAKASISRYLLSSDNSDDDDDDDDEDHL